jgi:membrane associated rhomboid family serine protease
MPYCYRHPDRETGLSCSECERPICYECMTPAPVGIRCPDHSGKAQGVQRVTRTVKRAGYEGTGALITKIIIGVNVGVWLLMLYEGASINDPGNSKIFVKGALFGPYVAQGDWWRLITSAFIHASFIHLALNMFVLWIVGGPMEQALGRGRFLLLYFASALAGSAGALLQAPLVPTIGASGAIFGLFGAALVMERQGFLVLGGSATSLVVVNLVFSFAFAGSLHIAWGGHIGGLVGGVLCALALSRFGRGHAAYSRIGIAGTASLVVVGILSIVVAYWRVRGYA